MKTIAAFTAGIALTLTLVWHNQTEPPSITVAQAETQIVEQHPTSSAEELARILRRLDNLDIDQDLPDDLHQECTFAIYRATGDDISGIIVYVRRHWEGDACAAAHHQTQHGWY